MKEPKELLGVGGQAVKEQMTLRRTEIGNYFWF
jgi:hypothetical protein